MTRKNGEKKNTRRQKKGKTKGIYVVTAIGIIVVAVAIGFNYTLDQAKIAGKRYGENLKQTQMELDTITSNLETELSKYKNNETPKEKMMEETKTSIAKLESLIKDYDKLNPPKDFTSSFELFKRSAESQLESTRMLKKWLETGDESYKIKSDELFQQSFEYETAAIGSYKKAKNTDNNP